MTLKQYIATMIAATIMCFTAWMFVIMNVDPFRSSAIAFFFFYISFFFSLVGLLSVVLFFTYKKVSRVPKPMFRYVQKSFRESIFTALFLTIALYLQGKGWLNFWNGTLLLLLFILYISFSLTMKRDKSVNHLPNTTL